MPSSHAHSHAHAPWTTATSTMSSHPLTTVVPIDRVVAIARHPTSSNHPSDTYLRFNPGDKIYVLNKNDNGWWDGIVLHGKVVTRGWFPLHFVKPYRTVSPGAKVAGNRRVSGARTGSGSAKLSSSSLSLSQFRSHSVSAANNAIPNSGRRCSAYSLSPTETSSTNVMLNPATPPVESGVIESGVTAHPTSLPGGSLTQNQNQGSFIPAVSPMVKSKSVGSPIYPAPAKDKGRPTAHGKEQDRNTVERQVLARHAVSVDYHSDINTGGFQTGSVVDKQGILTLDEVKAVVYNFTYKRSAHADRGHKFDNVSSFENNIINLLLDWKPIQNPGNESGDRSGSGNSILYYNEFLKIYCKSLPIFDFDKIKESIKIEENDYITEEKKYSQNNNNDKSKGVGNPVSNTTNLFRSKKYHNAFYYHQKDIRYWFELKDLIIKNLTSAHNAILSMNAKKFEKYFSLSSDYITYLNLACHLFKKYHLTNLKNSILTKQLRLFLKRIMHSLSVISIKSAMFFEISHINTKLDPDLKKSFTAKNSIDPLYYSQMERSVSKDIKNSLTLAPITPVLSRNQETLNTPTPENNMEYLNGIDPVSTGITSPFPGIINSKSNSISTLRNNSENNIKFDLSMISHIRIFELIDNEFQNINKNVISLYQLIINNGNTHLVSPNKTTNVVDDLDALLLPQLLPRFIKGSLNGGSWKNPFVMNSKIYPQNSKNDSKNHSVGSHNYNNYYNDQKIEENNDNDNDNSNNYNNLEVDNGKFISDYILHSKLLNNESVSKQNQSSSTMTDYSVRRGRHGKHKAKEDYPLNNATLKLLKRLSLVALAKFLPEMNHKRNNASSRNFEMKSIQNIKILNQSASKERNLEIISKTYEEINVNLLVLEVMENLDLSIFINLKRLILNPSQTSNDTETEEFLNHALCIIASTLMDFYNIKQLLHDIYIKLVMSAQQVTIDDDPYSFQSMKPNFFVNYYDPKRSDSNFMNYSKYHLSINEIENEKKYNNLSDELYNFLTSQDIENNSMNYLDTTIEFKDTLHRYKELITHAYNVVEQLEIERENLLNYSARMMKNNLIIELLKNDKEFKESNISTNYDIENYVIISDILNRHDSESRDDLFDFTNLPSDRFTLDDANIELGIQSESQSRHSDDSGESDLEWYLKCDDEENLFYDSKGRVKYGTKEALIEHLTRHLKPDHQFIFTMLLTFKSMFSTLEFLYMLVYRYNISPPQGLSYDEYHEWITKKSNPIKHRVVEVLNLLFTDYWSDFYYEDGLEVVLDIANVAVADDIPGSQKLVEIIEKNNIIKSASADNILKEKVQEVSSNPPANNTAQTLLFTSKLFKSKKFRITDIDVNVYAYQLTLLEHQLFSKITLFDCLLRAWGEKYLNTKGSTNISDFISYANKLTNYISYVIVTEREPKERAKIIEYFVNVADKCKELKNFSSMTAIISALYSSPIYRLKKTWPYLSSESNAILAELNSLTNSTKNFVKYRELVRAVKNVACVPFFGVYLSDLTFTQYGNSDFVDGSTELVNFSKRNIIADIIFDIMRFKNYNYDLEPQMELQNYIKTSLEGIPHIEKQYELSLQLEARVNNNAYLKATYVNGSKNENANINIEGKGSKLLNFGRKNNH
ncbi:hypothetical protein TPHA_0F00380 [Tetrapisispora phaffii CBS 4417]|uniref:SH3 domain-containing protein n=1 Tax=Tetrapisispora phaffii (strain ATCC 24235 / CBS 4417 / NBRC 1672 / NRRL Y-8282 / UCD 70-5) TaxID=1071381 RepID=G8BUU3_TETPH|nr:hypothetical protein TPHA_0F00380 [Tetrapisispora phaffii CBS 4417]CCE63525.1 hypothetical protein TPHA_0F00380 [Tetrapisispora phaffii CBS 4417]